MAQTPGSIKRLRHRLATHRNSYWTIPRVRAFQCISRLMQHRSMHRN